MGAYERNLETIPLPAGGDLTGNQYRFVTLDADGKVITCSADTDIPTGILQNEPHAEDEVADVGIGGISICIAGGPIDEGKGVGPNATGKAEDHTTVGDKYIGGRAITAAGADKDQFSVLIAPVAIRGHA